MRRSRDAKAETHQEIVAHAARLFRERGIEQTSVADVMQAAKLTHGGFYRHFQSKDDLVAAAMERATGDIIAKLEAPATSREAADLVDEYVRLYLSDDHVRHPGLGCPIPALGVEVGRIGGPVMSVTAGALSRLIGAIAGRLPGPKQTSRERALHTFATLVGAVVIARAAGNDPIGTEVLAACRRRLGLKADA